MSPFTSADASALRTLARACDTARATHPEITASALQVLVLAATMPGCTSADLMQRTGLSQSSVSRHVAGLSDYPWQRGQKALSLLKTDIDPEDRRKRRITLTPKGTAVVRRIVDALGRRPDADAA